MLKNSFLVSLSQVVGGCYKDTAYKCVNSNQKPLMILMILTLTWNINNVKKIDDDVMPANSGVIDTFPIYD